MGLFISNVALVVDPSSRRAIGGLAAGLSGTSALFNVSDILQSFGRVKLSSIS